MAQKTKTALKQKITYIYTNTKKAQNKNALKQQRTKLKYTKTKKKHTINIH